MSNNTQSILKVFSGKNVLDQETIGIKTMSKVKRILPKYFNISG